MSCSKQVNLIRQRALTEPVVPASDAKQRTKLLTDIRAVVFDIYGTLFSSGVGDISLAAESDRDSAMRATFAEHGIRLHEKAKSLRLDSHFHTCIHASQKKRQAAGIAYPEVEIREVWQSYLEQLQKDGMIAPLTEVDIETLAIDYETRVNPVCIMPGLTTTLEKLQARNYKISIISNAQFYTPLLFEAFLGQSLAALKFCLNCSVWSYTLLEGKPSMRLYEDAAECLAKYHKVQPEQVLYVGNDMRNDIWPAQQTGFKTALFAGDSRSLRRRNDHPDCKNRLADIEITHLEQLLDCI